jgi:hypothetical protein
MKYWDNEENYIIMNLRTIVNEPFVTRGMACPQVLDTARLEENHWGFS